MQELRETDSLRSGRVESVNHSLLVSTEQVGEDSERACGPRSVKDPVVDRPR